MTSSVNLNLANLSMGLRILAVVIVSAGLSYFHLMSKLKEEFWEY